MYFFVGFGRHQIGSGPGVHHGIAQGAENVRVKFGARQCTSRGLGEDQNLFVLPGKSGQPHINAAGGGSHEKTHFSHRCLLTWAKMQPLELAYGLCKL